MNMNNNYFAVKKCYSQDRSDCSGSYGPVHTYVFTHSNLQNLKASRLHYLNASFSIQDTYWSTHTLKYQGEAITGIPGSYSAGTRYAQSSSKLTLLLLQMASTEQWLDVQYHSGPSTVCYV